MPLIRTLRAKLLFLFICAVMVPSVLMPLLFASYSRQALIDRTRAFTDSVIRQMGKTILLYQNDLERLTMIPYFNDDIMYALKYRSSPAYAGASDYDRLVTDRAFNTTLPMYIRGTRPDILSFTLIMGDESVFFANKDDYSNLVNGYDYSKQAWFRAALKADGKAVFVGAHESDYFTGSLDRSVFSVAREIKDPDSRRFLGVMVADADAKVLSGLLNDADFAVRSKVALFDSEGQLICSDGALPPALADSLRAGARYVRDGREGYQVVSTAVPESNWRIVVLLSSGDLSSRNAWIFLVGALFMVVNFGLGSFLYRQVTVLVVAPLERMTGVLQLVQRGNLDVEVEAEGKYELADFASALNHMIRELKEHINREYVAALDRKTAEYDALQSQIKPHFLHNTLNGLMGLNRLGERELLERSILDLSGMLRYVQEPDDRVTLAQELDFLESYCRLQRIRFPDRLELSISCESELRGVRIPRLLLQPLVENAVIHGLEPISRACRISVAAYRDSAGRMEIRVEDDGAGFAASASSEGIGLANVRARLAIAFPGSTLSVESSVGAGCRVALIVPLDADRGALR
jgi:two-component system, sensor histidine kinase YesM